MSEHSCNISCNMCYKYVTNHVTNQASVTCNIIPLRGCYMLQTSPPVTNKKSKLLMLQTKQQSLPGMEDEEVFVDTDYLAETIAQKEADGWKWIYFEVGKPGISIWRVAFRRRMEHISGKDKV